jgi:hypothetical protein
MRAVATGLVVLGVLWILASQPASARDYEDRIAVEPGGHLRIEIEAGAVEVEGDDEDELRVEASASGMASPMRFELHRDGDEVRLTGQRGGVGSWLDGGRVRVRVRLPTEFSVEIRTGGGAIEVEDLEGSLDARTS